MIFRLLIVAGGYAPLEPAAADPQKGPVTITLNLHDLDSRDPGLVLRGRVLDGNIPVTNATVRAFGIKTGENSWQFGSLRGLVDPLAVTDDRGEFRLGVMQKDAPIYVEANAPFLAPGKVGPFTPGPTIHEVKLVTGAIVRGKVVKEGKPVPGVTLMLASRRNDRSHGGPAMEFHLQIATDPQGFFLFRNVPPDREYYLCGLMDSCAPHGAISARLVGVRASSTSEDLGEVAMQPGHRFEGRLVMADGKAVPAAARISILLFREEVGFADGQGSQVAADGQVRFSGLPAGRYTLGVTAKGYHLSPKNQSYDLLSSYNQLTGKVDRDLQVLHILLEPGPKPAPAADPNSLAKRDRQKFSEELRRRREGPLQGIPTEPVKEVTKVPLFPPRGDKDGPLEALREAANALAQVDGDPMERSRLWCTVAKLFHELGDGKGALTSMQQACAIIDTARMQASEEYRDIGKAYGRLGNTEAILKIVASVPKEIQNRTGNLQETVLQESALAAGSAGHIREAEQLADALASVETKTWVKARIRRQALVNTAKTGDPAGAIRSALALPTAEEKIFALVGQDILNLTYDDYSDNWAVGIAPAQLAAGDKAGAKATALQALGLLPDVHDSRKASAALAIVRILAKMDELMAARKALAPISGIKPKGEGSPNDRQRVMAGLKARGYLAAAAVRAGQDQATLALAADFELPGQKAYIFHWAALAQARAGRKDPAKANFDKAIELVTVAGKKNVAAGTTLHNIASAQALAGDFVGARKTAEGNKGITWTNISYAQAQAGDFEGARKTAAAHMQDSWWWHAKSCQAIGSLQAKAGQVAAVREWARTENDSLLRAYILVGAAEGLFREAGKAPTTR